MEIHGKFLWNELMTSDVPSAVAWYGRRTCVWLPMDIQNEFRAINAKKPIVVDVDLVNVIFSVFDKKGKVIADLDQKEVRIREDDGQQTITNFTLESNVPLAIALLMWRFLPPTNLFNFFEGLLVGISIPLNLRLAFSRFRKI